MQNGRLIVRHAIVSFAFVVLFFVLNRPEVIFVSQLGLSAWYPATGLVLALLLGISPRYVGLVCLCNVLSGVVFYHRALFSFIDTVGGVGIGLAYAVAAYVLRGPLKIDLGLRRRRDVGRYIFVTMVADAATTAVGTGSLVLGGAISRNAFWPAAAEWFLGDGIALLGVAPFLLIHVLPWIRARLSQGTAEDARHYERDRGEAFRFRLPALAEGVGQAAAMAAVLWLMFGPLLSNRDLFYLGLLPILWIAMRQGIRRAVSGLLVFNFGIVVAVHLFLPTPGVIPKLGLFMLVVSGVGLVTGSAVSERHRIALELREQTNHLNLLIANSPFGIVVLDPQGRVELSNAAFEKLSLFDRAELCGMNFEDIFLPGSAAPDVIRSVRTILPGDSLPSTVRRLRRDGHMLDLEVYAVPLAADGRVHGSYMIVKDISEQVRVSHAEGQHAQALNAWSRSCNSEPGR